LPLERLSTLEEFPHPSGGDLPAAGAAKKISFPQSRSFPQPDSPAGGTDDVPEEVAGTGLSKSRGQA
jgi:hypothetical protein